MLIGIDLLWVRPNICGGTESVIRNLMNGFGMYDDKNEYILFAGKDVSNTFRDYENYPNMKIHPCDTESMKRVKRIAWENSNLDKLARSLSVDLMLIPVYSKPKSLPVEKGGIPYITVIHDLQALHFPQYFSKPKIFFAKRSWKKACEESEEVVTISEFCRNDIIEHYPVCKDKISVIYNPIVVSEAQDENLTFHSVSDKYGIEKDGYFYTVSSMLPHKNLSTLIKVMAKINSAENTDSDASSLKGIKLVVSGVGGKKDEFLEDVKNAGVEDYVCDTGFVSDEERDALYSNCKMFLFPSTFEGFGMPPVESMMKGAVTVTTRCASIEEITNGEAVYVDDATDADEWVKKLAEALNVQGKKHTFPEYELKYAAEKYISLFESVKNKALMTEK